MTSSDTERKLLLSLIENVWADRPDLTLGQILSNAARFQGKDVYYASNEELRDGLLDVKRSRKPTPPPRTDPPQDPFPPVHDLGQLQADVEAKLTEFFEDPGKFFRNIFRGGF